jgi:hypothetical protein
VCSPEPPTEASVSSAAKFATSARPPPQVLTPFGKSRFFDQLAPALQFPYYFGENWNALWDCIADLSRLKGSSLLVVFDAAEHLLSESDRGFQF